jgi:hypothetical protein
MPSALSTTTTPFALAKRDTAETRSPNVHPRVSRFSKYSFLSIFFSSRINEKVTSLRRMMCVRVTHVLVALK